MVELEKESEGTNILEAELLKRQQKLFTDWCNTPHLGGVKGLKI